MDLGSAVSEIRDPEKTYSGSRIHGLKRHRILDPDPQHCPYLRSGCSSQKRTSSLIRSTAL
jgi:hypothetical protein